MSQSFTAEGTGALAEGGGTRRKVLVTGAAGRIGSWFAEHSHQRYELRLMVEDKAEAGDIQAYGEVVEGKLGDLDGLKSICEGMDAMVHLAADPSPSATWESVQQNNITGTYNALVAAKSAGLRRVVYASSIHAVSAYPADVQVKTSEPVNPGDLYGVSKCFGEAMGRYMAEKEGLSVIAIRIGAFQPLEKAKEEGSYSMMDAFVSRRDLNQLIQKCVDVENVKWAVLHGISNNRFKRLDISDARELVGYDPQDDLTEMNPELKDLHLKDKVGSHSGADSGESGIREEI